MPKGDVVLASFVIIAVLLAPIGLAYACDQMRTYTQDKLVLEIADIITRVEVTVYNGSEWFYPTQDYVITDDNYVLVPSISSGVDIQQLKTILLYVNKTLLNGAWLWQQKITKMVVGFEGSVAINEPLTVQIIFKDTSNAPHSFDVVSITPNASSFTVVWEPTTIQLAQIASYDEASISVAQIALKGSSDLGYREGDYFAVRVAFYIAQKSFSQSQIEVILAAAGIAMLIGAVFATNAVDVRTIARAVRRR